MTPIASQSVAPPRVLECPVQLEAVLAGQHKVAEDDERLRGGVIVFEVRVQRVYASNRFWSMANPIESTRINGVR